MFFNYQMRVLHFQIIHVNHPVVGISNFIAKTSTFLLLNLASFKIRFLDFNNIFH